jgi:hypothetical protein
MTLCRQQRTFRAVTMTLLMTCGIAYANSDLVPPQVETKTPTGVSLSDGSFSTSRTDLSIGPMSLERFYNGSVNSISDPTPIDASTTYNGVHWSNNFDIYVMPARRNDPGHSPSTYARPIVHMGATASGMYYQASFASGAGVFENNLDARAGNLEWISGAYRYTDASGALYAFNPSVVAAGVTLTTGATYAAYAQRIGSITFADGRVLTFSYVSGKLKLVSDSSGFAIVFDWGTNGFVSAACGFNTAQIYVNTSTTCASASLKVTYSYTGTNNNLLASATDVTGQTENYTYDSHLLLNCLRPPGASGCKIANTWTSTSLIQTLADGATWTFGWTFWDQSWGGRKTERDPYGNGNVETQVVDPAGKTWYYTFTGSSPYFFITPGGAVTNYRYTGGMPHDQELNMPLMNMGTILQSVTYPEGNQYLVEKNGPKLALSKETWRAKSASGLADIVKRYTYSFAGTAAQVGKPIAIIDGRGNQTDYTYASHGGVLSEMGPAPQPGARRPLKLTAYAQKSAYIKNSSGSLVAAAAPIWVPVSETACQTVPGGTSPVCDSTIFQSVTNFEYGANGTANNIRLRGKTVSAGGVSLRTCFGYDNQGNRIWETTPRAALGSCP